MMKKKPQRYSYKKLLTTSKRFDPRINEQLKNSLERQKYNPSYQVKSSSKNKSAEKIFSVYQTANTKFKVGKFLNSQNHEVARQRIRTETDQFQKTKSNYNKMNSVRKIQNSTKNNEKDDKIYSSSKQNYNSSKPIYTNRVINDEKNRYLHQNTISKQRTFNKKLNLNSQLFENLNKNSLQKYYVPQTSKYEKEKKNYSFRKAHDSYRSGTKKTALQKYISQSLQNLQYPLKKKNSKQIRKTDDTISKQKKQFSTIKQGFLQLRTKQVIDEQRSKSPKYSYQTHYQQSSHRKLKTQKDESSVQKIEIKWQKKKKNPYDLSNQQADTFGDRFPDGFQKIKLLGRGGFSLVWLGQHIKNKKKYAVKQIITQSSHQTHIKEIWFGTYFFKFGGAPKEEFADCPGIKNLVKLYYYFINKKDTWILYEKCGDSLGNCLYELKGENYNGQKVYRIYYKEFYTRLRTDQNLIRKIILEVAKALKLLAQNNIVHSDLKTENILVKIKSEDESKTIDAKESGRLRSSKQNSIESNSFIEEVKLIDYGSSFVFNNLRQFSMATPEYMAPEILNFILYENQLEYIPKLFDYVQEYHDPWVIDIWSLGSVILEIISGIPLWMSLKTIVKRKFKELIRYGLFAVKGRTFDKIIKKQLEIVQNLDHYLTQQNYSDIEIDDDIKYLLKRMLSLNPAKRISPAEIIDFLMNNKTSKE